MGPQGSKWDNYVLIGQTGLNWVQRGPNGSIQVKTGPNRSKLIEIGSNRLKKSNMMLYGLIWSKMVQILTNKSSKWVRHNQVSCSSLLIFPCSSGWFCLHFRKLACKYATLIKQLNPSCLRKLAQLRGSSILAMGVQVAKIQFILFYVSLQS